VSISRRWIWFLVLGLVVVGFVFAALRTPTATSTSKFITDDYGRAIIAHGFNTDNASKSSPDGLAKITEADLDREHADMGTNFVRLLISWRAVEPEPGKYDENYLAGVAERVSWYEKRGYHVMLDMHQDLWGVGVRAGGNQVGNGAPLWATKMDGQPVGQHDMWELYYLDPGVIRAFDNFWNTTGKHPELTEHYAKAWQAVAKYFAKSETVVAYDLMNEPYGGTIQGPRFEAGPLTSLYQRVTEQIRQVDQDSWICVQPQAIGYNWGTPSGLRKIEDPRQDGPRVAYCPHLYPLPMDLGGGYVGSNKKLVDATIEAWRANTLRVSDRLGDVPILLGEFGLETTTPGAIDYVNRVFSVAHSMGAGTTYWVRDNGSWGPYEEDGSVRNLVPALNFAYPRVVAGKPINWDSAPDRVELTLIPDPNITAPTEFQLPIEHFENGAKVAGGEVVSWDNKTRILQVKISGSATRTVVVTPK